MAEYIEREALVDNLNLLARHEDECRRNVILGVVATIRATNPADVAPVVHGCFVHDGTRFAGGVDWWHCSNCGRLASGVETRFDYCPWCGARMDGDAE